MLKNKKRIFVGILIITLTLVLVGLLFHFGIQFYVTNQIETEIKNQAMEFESAEYDIFHYKNMYEIDIPGEETAVILVPHQGAINDNQLAPVSLILLTNKELSLLPTTDMDYKEIINYCSLNTNKDIFTENSCRHIKLSSKEYYVMARKKEANGEIYTAILIASPDDLIKFTGNINLIFIGVMLILGIILFFGSYQIGSSVERNKEKLTRYFQNASHELKTPIMSIQGYAEGLETGVIRDTKKAAKIILSESDRMSNLVKEILFLSKMDSGYLDINRKKMDVCEVLYDLMSRLETNVSNRNIHISITGADEPLYILGNESQLETAIENILSNALRYTKDAINVEVFTLKKHIRIDIFNNGEEISEKDMPHIFERFYKGQGGCHGIGLSITKEIIKAHKGKIEVHNANGVRFSILLKRTK